MTLPEESAFLQAIADDPDDDLPRLVYADWLDERGDPFGEFIRLQCERARMTPGGNGDDRLVAKFNTRDVTLWKSPEVRDGVLRVAGRPASFTALPVATPEARGLFVLFRRENLRASGLVRRGILEELMVPPVVLNEMVKPPEPWPIVESLMLRVSSPPPQLKGIMSARLRSLKLDLTGREHDQVIRTSSSDLWPWLTTDSNLPALREIVIRVWGRVDITEFIRQFPPERFEPLAGVGMLPSLERIFVEVLYARWDRPDAQFALSGVTRRFELDSRIVHCEYQGRSIEQRYFE